MYTVTEIADAMQAKLHGNGNASADFQLIIDSRTVTHPENSVFFAIKTDFNDGHKYIPELYLKGVHVFVVEENYKFKSEPESTFLIVKNTVQALQDLALFHRKKFSLPVLGITGSNGKTIVKEWLNQLMGSMFNICSNPKSYNSQIGVPISVWQLQNQHTLGLFEAGISASNEMSALEKIIQPTLGVLTHLGTAHNEGFDTPEQKLKEKLILFENCQKVYLRYNVSIFEMLNSEYKSFGFNEESADLNITSIIKTGNQTKIEAKYLKNVVSFSIPFTDEASIENACLCALVCLDMNCFDAIAMNALRPVSMRMELKKGIHRCVLVNDSYSNDLNALGTALSFLNQQAIHDKRTVILSDIEGSGLPREILYQQIKSLLLEKNIKRIVGIGSDYLALKSLFEGNFETAFFADTKDFLNAFYTLNFKDESILIKGARKFEFEKIVRKLEQESHGSMLEINLSAASKNLNTIKQKLPSQMKVMAMVKAFAYGSGSFEVAKLLQHKVDYLAVAYADEGMALRNSGIKTPIMVLNAGEEVFEQLIQYQLEPVVFGLLQFKSLINLSLNIPLKIHLELDTGMHRLGFTEKDMYGLTDMLQTTHSIEVASIFSHLSGSDEKQFDNFTLQQIEDFKKLAHQIENCIGYETIKHISNTAAALRFEQTGLNMVRIGIGLYGIDPTKQFENLLEPVFTLKTHISQIKQIEANESVGYSRKGMSPVSRRIAILALGYADGLNRALSNGEGGFWINGQYAATVGNVCMDMCMVDLKDIVCAEGDEAILFGKDHPIAEIASQLKTIPYEVLTSISQRVKRVYVSE